MPTTTYQLGLNLPEQIYVDANVAIAFLYKTHQFHKAASSFVLEALAQQRILAFSPLAFDEIWYAFMLQKHKELYGTNFKVSDPSQVARHVVEIEQITNLLLQLPNVRLVSATDVRTLILSALGIIVSHSFPPRDAFHRATMTQAGITTIATIDTDFERLIDSDPQLTVLRIS